MLKLVFHLSISTPLFLDTFPRFSVILHITDPVESTDYYSMKINLTLTGIYSLYKIIDFLYHALVLIIIAPVRNWVTRVKKSNLSSLIPLILPKPRINQTTLIEDQLAIDLHKNSIIKNFFLSFPPNFIIWKPKPLSHSEVAMAANTKRGGKRSYISFNKNRKAWNW